VVVPKVSGPSGSAQVISPSSFDAIIFDMDGVITDTARVHEEAWRCVFEEFLHTRRGLPGVTEPFTHDDYRACVDGRARLDGVEGFLASRGIVLDRGSAGDDDERPTAWGLANRKDRYFESALAAEGVRLFDSTIDVARQARATGMRTAVVTASRHRREVLEAVGVDGDFDAHVDGLDAARLGLAGKPDPALFLEAARRLDVDPSRSVVIEDAPAGVEAGRAGGFGLVVGVDRTGRPELLESSGADVVVGDLSELQVDLVEGGGR
jgi:alpha,alpha-trehalase